MKNHKSILSYLLLLIFISTSAFSQNTPPLDPEANPHRGIYVDKFYYIDPISWNNGPPYNLQPQMSILGTDINHDGFFEKEDALLSYCRDNHITYLLLLDLHHILSTGIQVWDENQGRNVNIEEHLCRFMNKARNEYCIDQIGAAADNASVFNDVTNYNNTLFARITPPIIIPQNQRTTPYFNPILLSMQDSTLTPADSGFQAVELLKMIYRLVNLQNSTGCSSYFNYIHMEYEYWHNFQDADYNIDAAHWIIDPSCSTFCCTEFSRNGNCSFPCGSNTVPSWGDARFIGHFRPVVIAMRSIADLYNNNHGYTVTDNHFLRTESYMDPYGGALSIPMGDYSVLFDGSIPGCPFSSCPIPSARMIDRLNPYNFFPYSPPNPNSNPPAIIDFDNWIYEYVNDINSPFALTPSTEPYTDLHPLFSAEKISNGGYDDYWGRWFDETKQHNIFAAEKIFYDRWRFNEYAHQNYVSSGGSRENAIHPGGVLWFAQSHMTPILDNPKIFVGEIQSCYPAGIGATVTFHYIGPLENPLSIDFHIIDVSNSNVVFPSGGGWLNEQTISSATYDPNPPDLSAPDIIATGLPVSTGTLNPQHPLRAIMRLNYDSGCQYTYSEDILITTQISIQAHGPVSFCDGGNVTLHANADPSTNSFQWNNSSGTIAGEIGQEYVATTSGSYSCTITSTNGSLCNGTSNVIVVNILPNPYIDILSDCGSSNVLYVGPLLNPSTTISGPGGVTYLWSTGAITDRINANAGGHYFVTVTAANGCTRTANAWFNPSSNAISLSIVGIPHNAANLCSSDGWCTIQGGQSPNHVSITDGVNTYFSNWTSGTQYTFTNLSPGNYTVNVSPGGGVCNGTISFTIGPSASNFIVATNSQSPTCYNGNNGSISIQSISVNSTYNIEIPAIGYNLQSAIYPSATFPVVINNLHPGVYLIKITDSNCNSKIVNVPIGNPNSFAININHTNVTGCHNSLNGSALVSVSGGVSPYHYQWDDVNSTQISSISNVGFGTYNVTVTDNNGCTSAGFTNISAPVKIYLSILSLTNVSCHGGNNGTATATVLGGTSSYSYSWNTTPIQTAAQSTGLTAGLYLCTVTDANGCTESISVTIAESPTLLATPYASHNTCIGSSNACVNANPSGGTMPYNYSWNTIPVQNTSHICNLNNGTYNVTVTDNNGCTNASSVAVTTSGICCGNFANSLPQTINTINIISGTNYSDGLNLIFHHEVSSNCILNNNIIEMEAGQYIIVHAPFTLTLNGCSIKSCGKMWKGIVLEDGANIILNNSFIYDAESAIHVMGTGDLQISQSHFINNNVGILYEPFNTHSGIFSIDQTEFKGTGVMKGQYHNQTTVIGTLPQAGIILNNFDVNLSSTSNPNVFQRMNSGFVIYDGTVNVNNARFIDIQPDPLIPGNDFDGCGVYASEPFSVGNSLAFQGFSYPYTNLNFEGCATGIRAEEININISDCNMGASSIHDMETGIHFLYGNTLSLYIANNSINATRFGINMEQLDGANEVTVTGNSIGIGNVNSGVPVSGIRLSNWGGGINFHGANPKYNIYHNYIHLYNNVDNGIEFLNVNNFNLIDNHIYPSNNNLQGKGISLSASHQNEISCNSVESTDPHYPNNNQAGIFATKSSENRYGCNIVDNTYNGFLFSESCPNSEIFGNTIKNHTVGIHLNQLCVIGQQPLVFPGSSLPGNIWDGSCSQWDALNENTTFDRYYYNNTTPSTYWQMGPQTFYLPSWFWFWPDRNFECGPYNVIGSYNPNPYCGNGTPDFVGGSDGRSLDEKIANDSLQFSSFNFEMTWSLKKYLFEKLKFNQSLFLSDSTFVQFYDSILNTVIKKFGDIKEKESEFFEQDSLTSSIVMQKTLAIKNDLAQIKVETELLKNTNITAIAIQTIKLDISTLQADILTLKNEIALILSQLNSGKLVVAGQTNSIIQSITTSETIEENLKSINESYYTSFAQGNRNFSATQVTLWQQIAEQCPVSGGEAVFKARGLYALVNPNIKYNDLLTCLQQGILYKKSQSKPLSNSFNLFPNPTGNSFTFYFLNEDPNSVLKIFDEFGRIIKIVNVGLHRLSIEVDVSKLNPGIYHVEFIQDDSITFKNKLVII